MQDYKRLIEERNLTMIRLEPKEKKPLEEWRTIGFRSYEDICFKINENAGIITNDIIVLDVDDPELFAQVVKHQVPDTFTVKTGKGYHYYFKRLDSKDYRGRAFKKKGYDIRANGGYVVAPGSVHPNGSTYTVVNDVELAIAPEWLLQESLVKPAKKNRRVKSISNYQQVDTGHLSGDLLELLTKEIPVGQRSEIIFKLVNLLYEEGIEQEDIVNIMIDSEMSSKFDPEGWIEEVERIIEKRDDVYVPEVLPPQYNTLANAAHIRAVSIIEKYGNKVSRKHSLALYDLMRVYSGMACGEMTGRNIVPFATGLGKTTGVVAFLSCAYSFDFLDKLSIAIATYKVEEICSMKRKLIAEGVPEELISLDHSYGDKASEPATEDLTRPILLMTHAKSKQKPEFFHPLETRTFTIWDEAMITTKATTLSVADFNYGITALTMGYGGRNDILDYFKDCQRIIADAKKNCYLKFPPQLFETEELEQLVKQVGNYNTSVHLKALIQFSRMVNGDVVFRSSNDPFLVRADTLIPDNIRNMVVLDASAHINKGMRLDSTLRTIMNMANPDICYANTKIVRLPTGAGRTSTTKNLESIKLEILEIVKAHPDEDILLFTFKPRSGQLNHEVEIKRFLKDHGFDKNLHWLTHGNEKSINKFAHCSVVIFVGIMHKSGNQYEAEALAQLRQPTKYMSPAEKTAHKRSELACLLHQGFNRGTSRKIDNGRAGALTAYFTYPDDSLEPFMKRVMSDACYEVKKCEHLKPPSLVKHALELLLHCLEGLEQAKVSVMSLRKLIPEWGVFKVSTRQRAVDALNDMNIGWKRDKSSLVRT